MEVFLDDYTALKFNITAYLWIKKQNTQKYGQWHKGHNAGTFGIRGISMQCWHVSITSSAGFTFPPGEWRVQISHVPIWGKSTHQQLQQPASLITHTQAASALPLTISKPQYNIPSAHISPKQQHGGGEARKLKNKARIRNLFSKEMLYGLLLRQEHVASHPQSRLHTLHLPQIRLCSLSSPGLSQKRRRNGMLHDEFACHPC